MADPFALTPFRDPGDSTMFADIQKIRKIRQDNELQRQQQERAAAFDADFNAMMESGVNSKAMSGLFLKYPEMSKKYADAFKGVKEDELRVHRLDLNKVSTLLDEEQPEIASRYLRDVAEKWKNSGFDDVASGYLSAADALEKNPTQGGLYLHGLHAAIDPDAANKAQEGLKTMEEVKQAAVETQQKELDVEDTPAKIAERKAKDERDARQQEITINKMNVELAKARKDFERGGRLEGEKKFNAENKLKNDVQKSESMKNFASTRSAYRRIQAASDTAQGDLGLIIGYMKMLDPGSVVREGEQVMVRQTGGIADRVWEWFKTLRGKEGARLGDNVRAGVVQEAENLMKASIGDARGDLSTALSQINEYGLSESNIFRSDVFDEFDELSLGDNIKEEAGAEPSQQIKFLGWE